MALARLNTVENPPRDADGGLAGLEALFSDSEPPGETRSVGGFFSVPVWKFVKERGNGGAEAADFGQPQYLCSHRSMSVRFSLIRHTDLRLQGGRRLLSLSNQCGGSAQTFGPWLLLKLPFTSCHMALWISNGTWFRQLKLLYFDHQLQANVTGVASCENPATSLQLPAPLVTCGATYVTVKLPLGMRLRMVKALGKDGAVGSAFTATTPRAVFVQMPKLQDMDSLFELIYSDSAGEMSTTLAPCLKAVTRSGQHRRRRQVAVEDLWEFWNFEELPVGPYDPQTTQETPTTDVTSSTTQDTQSSQETTLTTQGRRQMKTKAQH
ncbi:hypothetical protein INR49_005915 [Caranx melampygus]|nr:hypothetical protein INR49_005915 [Caranx melampygus]